MPIRFTCSQCRQRLSVPSEKADQDVKCPRCRQVVRVPAEIPAGVPVPPPGPPTGTPIPAIPTAEAVPDAVHSPDVSQPHRAAPDHGQTDHGQTDHGQTDHGQTDHGQTDHGQTVNVPRHVVYLQGLLLGVVALVFFVFGLIVGSGSRSESGSPPAQPCTITGTVLYEDDARDALPDESSIAIILPMATRPDQKAAVEGLRPADPEPGDTHPSMAVIRSLGGDYARVDRHGKYRLRVTTPGRYYLLIVSHHARRESNEQPQANDLAQIGRYFVPATSLLDSQQYTWKELRVREDVEFNCQF